MRITSYLYPLYTYIYIYTIPAFSIWSWPTKSDKPLWDTKRVLSFGANPLRQQWGASASRVRARMVARAMTSARGTSAHAQKASGEKTVKVGNVAGQLPFHSQEWSNWNYPCGLMKNLAFHSLLRWKMIILPILTYTFLFEMLGECTFWAWERKR